MMRARSRAVVLAAFAPFAWAAACGDGPTELAAGHEMELVLSGMRAVDPDRDGILEIWIASGAGDTVSAGRITLPPELDRQPVNVPFMLPVDDPAGLVLTLEPPGDDDGEPSPFRLLAGAFRDGSARLSIEGVVTAGPPLERDPGEHSLYTTSNNPEYGYPSFENAGLWLFTGFPAHNRHGTREVHVTPLRPAWVYEGWIVHGFGSPAEIWISYGKFRPDFLGLLTSRDNTGSGPFSGDQDYVNGGVEDVPGEEWTTNLFDFEVPGGFELPLELDAVDAVTGEAVWTHVITIEPAGDELEPLLTERPFLLRPYRNPIGAGGPGIPRVIRLSEDPPTGVAQPIR